MYQYQYQYQVHLNHEYTMTPGNDLPRLTKSRSQTCQTACLSSRYSSQGNVLSFLGLFEYQKRCSWRLLTSPVRIYVLLKTFVFCGRIYIAFFGDFLFSGRTWRWSCWKGEDLPVADDQCGSGAEDGP